MRRLYDRFLQLENILHHQLVAHSVAVLRVAVGAVFLGFGIYDWRETARVAAARALDDKPVPAIA